MGVFALLAVVVLPPPDLPPGAVARLGTTAQRAPGMTLRWADGGKVLLGGQHTRWRAWDPATGRVLRAGRVPDEQFGRIDWHDGGRHFAVAPAYNSAGTVVAIRLVEQDVLAGKVLHDWTAGPNGVVELTITGLLFSPDGRRVAGFEPAKIPGDPGRVCVLDWESKKVAWRSEPVAESLVSPPYFSADGSRVLIDVGPSNRSQPDEKTTHCFDGGTGKRLWEHETGGLRHGVWLAGGDVAVIAGEELRLFSSGNGEPLPLNAKVAAAGKPYSVVGTPDGRRLVVSGDKGTVVWDYGKRRVEHVLPVRSADLLVSPDGRTLVTNANVLRAWNLATGKPLAADTADAGHTDAVYRLAFATDGKRLVSSAADGTVRVWDAAAAKPVRTITPGDPSTADAAWYRRLGGVPAFALSRDRLATMTAAAPPQLWNASTGEEVARMPIPTEDSTVRQIRYPQVLRLSANGTAVSAGGFADGPPGFQVPWVLEWDTAKNQAHVGTGPKPGAQYALCYLAPDLNHWFTDRGLAAYTVADGPVPFATQAEHVSGVAFTPDATRVAVVGRFGKKEGAPSEVVVAEIPGGKPLSRFTLGKLPAVHQRLVVLDPQATRVALVLAGKLQVRDARTGKVLWQAACPEPAGEPTAIAVSPANGLATGHADGTILLWKLPER